MDLRLLGPLEVHDGTGPLALGGGKPRALLARLLLDLNRTVPAARLVEDLWGESPPESAPKLVQINVSQLRKVLPEGLLRTRSAGYAVEAEPERLDLHRFAALDRAGREALAAGDPEAAAERLRAALALWRGPALAEFPEPFAAAEAARLEELRLACLGQRVEADLQRGRHADLVGELTALAGRHPLREGVHAQLVRALYGAGRQADALAVYEGLRRRLDEELGLEPGDALKALQVAVLQHDPALAGPGSGPGPAHPPAAAAAPVPPRGVVTLLFTDLVGSTDLLGRLGDEAAEALLRRHFAMLREAVDAHAGRVVKTLGDGLMAVFASAADAVRCAVAVQRAHAGEADLEVRVGIHAGEPTRDGDDFLGAPVVVARRLCDRAAGRQVLASELVRGLAGDRAGVPFAAVGALALKGIADPVTAHEVAWEAGAADARAPAARARRQARELPGRLAAAAATPLVGRAAPLARARRALDEARAGRTGLLLVLGEGGIGKTRLVAELARDAPDVEVLHGRCDEEELVPFGPWIELLGEHLAEVPDGELPDLLGEGAHDLAQLLPGLAPRLPPAGARGAGDPETRRRRLFDAVVALVRRLAARRPLLLVLDDLHWADRSSLLLVRYLLRSAPLGAVLVLGTYRDTELAPGHPLVEVVADLERELGAELPRVRLEGLDVAETSELVAAWRGGPVAPAAVTAVHEQTNGNPFFLKQLVRHLDEAGDGGMAVPAGVRDVIGRRVARLPDPAGRVLRVAALVGRDFGLPVLAEVTGLPDDEVLDVLDGAVRAGLLAEVPRTPGRWSFAHALVRATLAGELSAARRARLHARVGEALERSAGGGDVEELARHFLAAGPDEAGRAIGYAAAAAEQALARLAYEEGADLLAQAVRAHAHARPQDRGGLARLLLLEAAAVTRTGRLGDARRLFAQAAGEARAAGDGERLARAALGHSGRAWEWYGTRDLASVALLEEALARLPEEDSALRARVLARLGGVLAYAGDRDRPIPLVNAAIAMARRSGDRAALVAALAAAQHAYWRPGLGEVRLRFTDELIALAEGAADLEAAAEAHAWRATVALELCRRADAEHGVARLAELAGRLRQPDLEAHAAAFRVMFALLEGDWHAGEAAALAMLDAGERADAVRAVQWFGVEMLQLRNEQGRLGELVGHFERLVRDVDALPGWRTAYAWGLVQAGRADEARAALAGLRADGFAALPVDANHDPALAVLAHLAEELGDAALAAEVEPLLRSRRGAWLVFGPGSATLGPIAYSVGVCALLTGRAEQAVADFELALARAEEVRAAPYVARAHFGLARALRQLGADDRAAEHAGRAREGATALRMVRLLRQLDAEAAAAAAAGATVGAR